MFNVLGFFSDEELFGDVPLLPIAKHWNGYLPSQVLFEHFTGLVSFSTRVPEMGFSFELAGILIC